jgi:hypothetical protein
MLGTGPQLVQPECRENIHRFADKRQIVPAHVRLGQQSGMLVLEHLRMFVRVCGEEKELTMPQVKTTTVCLDDAAFAEEAHLQSALERSDHAGPLFQSYVQLIS